MRDSIETSTRDSCYAVMLAGLLHDVGTFVQRAGNYPSAKRHTQLSEEWYQTTLRPKLELASVLAPEHLSWVQSLIANHHSGAEYVSLADAIATGTTSVSMEDEEQEHPCSSRLLSILSRISLSERTKKPGYCRLASLGQDGLEETFPTESAEATAQEYADLHSLFEKEARGLDFADMSADQVIDRLTFLLWKYCWCVPSGNYATEPDVSLYDHLRITASVAGCLHDFHSETPDETSDLGTKAFYLIAGDISGIQDYILSILPQQGKIAKRLRARSLFVQLLSDVAAHRILHEFKLPLCNNVMSAGGNFYVLVPYLTDTKKKMETIRKEFDDWTLNHLNAELSVNLAGIEATGEDLADFPVVVGRLKKQLNEEKHRSHRSVLVSAGGWNEDEFLRPQTIDSEEKICESCRKHRAMDVAPGGGEEALCERCYSDAEIGKRLPNSAYIAFFKESSHSELVSSSRDGSRRFEILGYSFELWPTLQSTQSKGPYLVLALNREAVVPPSIGFRHLALHIPTEEQPRTEDDSASATEQETSHPLTFDGIADAAQGDKLLGYVKADVDNMGTILGEGFKHGHSLPRYVVFSRLLETFFSGYLQAIMEREFKDIYTVFSGGDDFFLVGPWNMAIDFARRVRKEFSRYCSSNGDLTFSAGIFLAQPHEPIAFCAEMAEDELKKSKRQKGKDKVTLFAKAVGWSELEIILREAGKVVGWLQAAPPIISRGLAHRLQRYGEMAEKSGIYANAGEENPEYLKFVPLLHYDINRNLAEDAQQDAREWAVELLPSVAKPHCGDNLPYLKVIMEYVLTLMRAET